MSWGEGNIDFNNILMKIFKRNDPEFRKYLFYFICIIFRFVLYISLLFIIKYDIVFFFVAIFAFFGFYNLYTTLNQTQWWSKKFQLIICFIIICLSLYIYFTKNNQYRKYIPLVLLFSLFGGILQSIIIL
jgi:hypothetical protein